MYRKSIQDKEMAAMELESQNQFLSRVGNLPVMTTAVGQLCNIYLATKERNCVLRYTLETAERSVGVVASTTMPVVNRLEKPIGMLNTVACSQLDKLEHSYPIITKPTEEVVEETKQLYNHTLKPTVDRVSAVTQYGVDTLKPTVDKVSAVTQYGVDKYTGVKEYGVNTYTGVKQYGVDKVTGVKNYTYSTIDGVKSYGMSKVTSAKGYTEDRAVEMVKSEVGQGLVSRLDDFLQVADQYVDHYMPREEDEKVRATAKMDTFSRMTTLSDKVRHRMYVRAMRELQHVQKRTRETLDRLNFTVDLIQYAKTNMDSVQTKVATGVTSGRDKVADIWAEINRTEEDLDMEGVDEEETNPEARQITNATLERRMIATARHLTQKLKTTVGLLSSTAHLLPTLAQQKYNNAKNATEELYNVFTTPGKLGDISQTMLDQARQSLTYIQSSIAGLTTYATELGSEYLGRLAPELDLDLDFGSVEELLYEERGAEFYNGPAGNGFSHINGYVPCQD